MARELIRLERLTRHAPYWQLMEAAALRHYPAIRRMDRKCRTRPFPACRIAVTDVCYRTKDRHCERRRRDS
jgi:hypothetical protein